MKTAMKITKTLLKKHKACQEGIDQFNALFPKGVEWKFNDPEFAAKVLASPLAAHLGWAIDHLPDFQPFHISTGNHSNVTAGDGGTATAGDGGTATAGSHGTATAGYCGTVTAGNYGTATAGDYGTATAGDGGILVIKYYDGNRYRFATAYVGENGILPNTPYRLDDNHNFVPK